MRELSLWAQRLMMTTSDLFFLIKATVDFTSSLGNKLIKVIWDWEKLDYLLE